MGWVTSQEGPTHPKTYSYTFIHLELIDNLDLVTGTEQNKHKVQYQAVPEQKTNPEK